MNAILFSAAWGVILMFTGAFGKNKTTPKYLAIFGAAMLLVLNGIELYTGKAIFDFNSMNMLALNSKNLTFLQVFFASTLVFFLVSGRDIEKVGSHVAEYFALIFFVLCGVTIASTYNTLLMLFIGIEILSIPLYVLTGSDKFNLKSNEAALKYFLMGAFSTGILLMGIAFIYGGNINASFFIDNIQLGDTGKIPVLITVGLIFLLVAMSFKVSAAPFHFWTPDVYDGAPTVFTSFMSTIIKVAGFYAFIRLFGVAFGKVHDQWQNLIIFVTLATMLIGNVTAVFQQSVKRMLAYSSIAQAGFMLLALFALNDKANEALLLYSAAYCLATIGIFAIVIRIKDYTINGFNGLGKQQPLLALTTTIFLLSLTGIPLTAGFTGKFYMLMAAAENGHQFWIIIVAVLFAAISAYYYFRIIQAIYFKEATTEVMENNDVTFGYKGMLVIIAVLIIILGIFPELLIGWMYH